MQWRRASKKGILFVVGLFTARSAPRDPCNSILDLSITFCNPCWFLAVEFLSRRICLTISPSKSRGLT